MRILADYHHSDLFESYQLTFGDRFGWEVFRPIGMEWFEEKLWNFERAYHGDAVARQYLGPWDTDTDRGDWWERIDHTHPGRTYRMVTLEQARAMSWDLLLSSVPDNDHGWAQLRDEWRVPWIVQIGNQWQGTPWYLRPSGALVSALGIEGIPVPHVIYHQEFRLSDFRYEPPPRMDPFQVSSFVQCLPENPKAYEEFLVYAREDPTFDWRIYGAYGSHDLDEYAAGNLPSTPAVAAGMRDTDAIWHTKEWSDGYGHVIHNAFAVGRPVIGRESYYRDKLAGPLWQDGITSWDLGRHGAGETRVHLARLRDDPEYHVGYCERAAVRFREVVDFDADAEAIGGLLEQVIERVAA